MTGSKRPRRIDDLERLEHGQADAGGIDWSAELEVIFGMRLDRGD